MSRREAPPDRRLMLRDILFGSSIPLTQIVFEFDLVAWHFQNRPQRFELTRPIGQPRKRPAQFDRIVITFYFIIRQALGRLMNPRRGLSQR